HSSSSMTESPAYERSPSMRWKLGTSKSKPISLSWRIARGVSPSPQVLSRGYSFRSTRVTSWPARRSEEHTSELQSREKLVCRLLLEKKKNRTNAVYSATI